jgi:hypothetical protein
MPFMNKNTSEEPTIFSTRSMAGAVRSVSSTGAPENRGSGEPPAMWKGFEPLIDFVPPGSIERARAHSVVKT